MVYVVVPLAPADTVDDDVLADLDPMGAIIVCLCCLTALPRKPLTDVVPNLVQIAAGVILAWGRTIYRQFELLAGKSAPHDFIQLLVYKAMTFSEEISQIDTVRAYHVSCQVLYVLS